MKSNVVPLADRETRRDPMEYWDRSDLKAYFRFAMEHICEAEMTPQARHVALVIWLHMRPWRMSADLSKETLMRLTGLSDGTIKNVVRMLRDKVPSFEVVTSRGRNHTNKFLGVIPQQTLFELDEKMRSQAPAKPRRLPNKKGQDMPILGEEKGAGHAHFAETKWAPNARFSEENGHHMPFGGAPHAPEDMYIYNHTTQSESYGDAAHAKEPVGQMHRVIAQALGDADPDRPPRADLGGCCSLSELRNVLFAAGGEALADDTKQFRMSNLSIPLSWIGDGASLELDIVPTIQELSRRKRPREIDTWQFFTKAIADAKARREKPLPAGNPNSINWQERERELLRKSREALESLRDAPPEVINAW